MDKNTLRKTLEEMVILPEIPTGGDEAKIASSLKNAGLPAALLDFCAADRSESVRIMRSSCDGMLIGAYAGKEPAILDRAIAAGCDFVLTDGIDQKQIAASLEKGVPIIPICASWEDFQRLNVSDIAFVALRKDEPEQSGLFIMDASKGSPKPVARIDRTIVSGEWTEEGAYEKITADAETALLEEIGFEPYHVGLNSKDRDEALVFASRLSSLFRMPMIETHRSFLIGDLAEVMMLPYYGAHGHMGVRTRNLRLAMGYLKRKGVEFNMATYEENEDGIPKIVYLKEEIGGFAVHLTQIF